MLNQNADATTVLKRFRALDESWPTDRFVPQSEIDERIARFPAVCSTGDARELAKQLIEPDKSELLRLALRYNNLQTSLAAANEAFVARRVHEDVLYFDGFTTNGMTDRQREAVVTDADVTLVVAGAGTGKTTTIVAKIDYLVRHGLARPHEILVLAYNKQAQLELKSRIENLQHGHQVRAVTFHAFGYGVVRQIVKPEPEPINESAPRAIIHRELDQLRRNQPVGSSLRRAMESFRSDFASQEKLATFVTNILNFLNRYKTRRSSIASLRRSIRSQRQRDFLTIFEHLVGKYDEHIRKSNGIDFSDMIVRATDLIESGEFVPRYRYILIDEFQDITQARWRMIQSIRNQNSKIKLFVVGDDWQSIYAFDDADVSIMTGLQQRVKGVARVDLDTTFRFPQPMADKSSEFIMRNPTQLRKSITSAHQADSDRPIVIHRYDGKSTVTMREVKLKRLVQEIANERPNTSLLMLGRYRKTIPDNWNELVALASAGGVKLTYHTCHAAKGLEADEVIVLDVIGGAMGFPCRIPDDEFIQLLPTPSDAFADAEERRLFYVALTRTRDRVHLFVDDNKPSSFIDDIDPKPAKEPKSKKSSRQPATRLEIPFDSEGRVPHCPSCNKPTFIKRVGAKGAFWGCSDFPKCWGRPRKCPSCSELAFVLDGPDGNRYCAECGSSG